MIVRSNCYDSRRSSSYIAAPELARVAPATEAAAAACSSTATYHQHQRLYRLEVKRHRNVYISNVEVLYKTVL